MRERITILLAGEFLTEQTALRAVLAADERFLVVGEVANVADLLPMVETLDPQMIILDLDLPGDKLLETIALIKQGRLYMRILVLTRRDDDESVFAAIKAGALGYVINRESAAFINAAVSDIARGESALSPLIARKLIRELHRPVQLPPSDEPLTDKEQEVLVLVARGFSNQEIAAMLALNERTVRTHISNILSKLHLATRTQAGLWALKEGLLDQNRFSPQFERVQTLCHQLRGTLEGTLEGEPAFFVGGKAYAVYLEGTQPDRPFALLLPLPYGMQKSLLLQSPHKFFPAPRYAEQGWVAMDLTQVDEDELRYYLQRAWRLVVD